MPLRLLALLFLLPSLLASSSRSAPNPAWGRLRAYRNHLVLQSSTAMAHRFTAWFTARGLCRADIAADDPEAARALEREDLHLSTGGFAIPPDEVPPPPPELTPVVEALEARLRELIPELSGLKIRHQGRFSTLRFEEVTPLDLPGDPERRLARRSTLTMGRDEGSSVLRPVGPVQFYGGVSRLVPHRDEEALPHLVDWTTPAGIEGFSVVRAQAEGLGGEFAAAWRDAQAALIRTAAAIRDGSYQNPLEALLRRHGTRALPAGFDGGIEYEVTTYARAKDFQDQVGEHPAFRFSLAEVAAGPVTRTHRSTATGLSYAVTLDLAAATLRVVVRTRDDEVLDLAYRVKGDVIRAGEDRALAGSWLEILPGDTGFDDHSLPGNGWFTSFDVYPESAAYAPSLPPSAP